MPKPFLVEYTVYAVVMAEDDTHAHQIADSKYRDVFYDMGSPDGMFVRGEIKTQADLDGNWDLDCIPYNGDGNTRISEYLKNKE